MVAMPSHPFVTLGGRVSGLLMPFPPIKTSGEWLHEHCFSSRRLLHIIMHLPGIASELLWVGWGWRQAFVMLVDMQPAETQSVRSNLLALGGSSPDHVNCHNANSQMFNFNNLVTCIIYNCIIYFDSNFKLVTVNIDARALWKYLSDACLSQLECIVVGPLKKMLFVCFSLPSVLGLLCFNLALPLTPHLTPPCISCAG